MSLSCKKSLPKEVPTLLIDGLHALSWRGNITAKELYFSRTYAELDGTIAIERLQVGSHPYSIPAHPKPDRDYAASLVIKGTHGSSKTLIVNMKSFIDIKEGFYVGSKWRSPPSVRGLVIDSQTSDRESNLLFARFYDSQIKVSSITLQPQATLLYYDVSVDVPQGFKLNPGSQLRVGHSAQSRHQNVIKGIIAAKNSLLSFRLSTFDHQTRGLSTSTSLRIEKPALINGHIVPSAWHLGNDFRSGFQKLLAAHNNELLFIKAAKLYGRASLGSRQQLENFGTIDEEGNNQFQVYLRETGKKLALKHDYNQGTISLMIIDQNVATDSDSCLPDIGSYNKTEAQRLADTLLPHH